MSQVQRNSASEIISLLSRVHCSHHRLGQALTPQLFCTTSHCTGGASLWTSSSSSSDSTCRTPQDSAPQQQHTHPLTASMQHTATSSLSSVAARRIQSELTDWGRNPPDGCCLESCEPITHWTIIMAGPESGSAGLPRLYEGEVFRCGSTWGGYGWLNVVRR